MKKTMAGSTKYAAIFKKCYWGTFDADLNKAHSTQTIIDNRNNFVDLHGIKSVSYITGQQDDAFKGRCTGFDHTEVYVTLAGEVLVITSPYTDRIEDCDIEEFKKIGMEKTMPLYSIHATTFLIKFGSRKHFNNFCMERKRERKKRFFAL